METREKTREYGEAYHELKDTHHYRSLLRMEEEVLRDLKDGLVEDTSERNAGMIQGIQSLIDLRLVYEDYYIKQKEKEKDDGSEQSDDEYGTNRTEPDNTITAEFERDSARE